MTQRSLNLNLTLALTLILNLALILKEHLSKYSQLYMVDLAGSEKVSKSARP